MAERCLGAPVNGEKFEVLFLDFETGVRRGVRVDQYVAVGGIKPVGAALSAQESLGHCGGVSVME